MPDLPSPPHPRNPDHTGAPGPANLPTRYPTHRKQRGGFYFRIAEQIAGRAGINQIRGVPSRARGRVGAAKEQRGSNADAADHNRSTRRRWHSDRGTDLTAYAAGRERRTGRCRSDGRAFRARPGNAAAAVLPSQAPVGQDWLDNNREEIIEPALPIIDPHRHLWDRPGYRYLFTELLADVGSGNNIRATCYEQAREMYRADGPEELKSLGETEFVSGVSAMSASGKYGPTRCITGIIGFVDLRLGSRAKGILERHIAVSDGRLRGIRNGSTWSDDPTLKTFTAGGPQGLLLEKSFREGFATLAPLGLTFDAWMFQTQLGDVVDLARAFPQTTIVLNHCGAPLAIGPYAGKREEGP